MSDWLKKPSSDGARMTIPTIWVGVLLSLLLHAFVLFGFVPREHEVTSPDPGNASGPLVVSLAPDPSRATSAPSAPPPSPALQEQATPPRRAPAPKAAPRQPPTTPVITQERPAAAAAAAPATPSVAAPAPVPVEGDFAADFEARRRARAAAMPSSAPESASTNAPVEDERERHNRAVASNLGLDRTPTFGRDRTGGGVFQIEHMTPEAADFVFFGWNKDIRRNSRQTIEVKRGTNADIRIALVRRMIVIIRDNESGDFVWISQRLGRNVTLSARPSDNAGLEEFMMQEFFTEQGRR